MSKPKPESRPAPKPRRESAELWSKYYSEVLLPQDDATVRGNVARADNVMQAKIRDALRDLKGSFEYSVATGWQIVFADNTRHSPSPGSEELRHLQRATGQGLLKRAA